MAVLVNLELEPRATGGDELHAANLNAIVQLPGKVHAGRADELRYDDALDTLDDEGTTVGHERKVAHEDELLLHLASRLVDKAHANEHRRLVREVLGDTAGDGLGRLAKHVVAKGDLHGLGGILDGRELGEGL